MTSLQFKDEEFEIDENNVDGELCQVGKNLSFYGNLASDLKANASAKKADLEITAASIATERRKDAEITGTKITEGRIKESVLTDERYKQAVIEHIDAERDAQKIENLFRSQQKRADCLIALAYKQRTEISKANY